MNEESEVIVSRNLGGVKICVPASALSGLHIAEAAGGTGARLSRPSLAAYMSCESIPDDYFPVFGHSCRHGPPPHRIKVVIPKGVNERTIYAELLAAASARAVSS